MPSIKDTKCILIIGSTAGLGRALALSILALPSKPTVIVCGRRQERIDELIAVHGTDGRLKGFKLDLLADRASLKASIAEIVQQYPQLDAVMFMSGIQHEFNFTEPESVDLDKVADELNTNYLSIINAITLFLPQLIKIGVTGYPSFIYTVTSGLGVVPGAWVPNYCATKAALHSLSLTLNAQLKSKNVHVVEILPPLVESELHDHQGKREVLSKFWMPLDEFTALTIEALKSDDVQIPIGSSVADYEGFEKGKLEAVTKMYDGRKAATGGK
ncbi:NAD(P)-binding protein [Hygrophoropsis aurantiaca]|uniref:NAD(P)-binding protein n=1 Tax=Hygrophoropsis aurantiaca TaxID=72124 RepID=A0ACB8A289_9AGAM|nr:NAD(P)-binding protein [Hygrophoropsis aurantiaca]